MRGGGTYWGGEGGDILVREGGHIGEGRGGGHNDTYNREKRMEGGKMEGARG